jgi:capsular polysaccharide export protein
MMISRIRQREKFLHTEVQLAPLLRSPFDRNHLPISQLKRGWVDSSLDAYRHAEVRNLILGPRIGGCFWKPIEKLPAKSFEVIVFPRHVARAQRLWGSAIASHSAETLLVVYPLYRALQPLLRRIKQAGATIAPSGDAYPVLDLATRVYADGSSDLGSLAALADIASFISSDNRLEQISPHAVSAKVDAGTVYLNPFTGAAAGIEEIAEILLDWRRVLARNRAIGVCAGVSLWKRRHVKELLHTGERSPVFRRSTSAVIAKATSRRTGIAAWVTRMPAMLESNATSRDIPLIRMEDGFIRSLGLGSALTAPASIVADRKGIYFDPTKPSDLEVLLSDTVFSAAIKQRAARLIDLLAAKGVSKYGVGGDAPLIEAKAGQRIILVPGQVADDLSLQLGASGPVRTNLELLRQVRQRNPNAFIVYRPHPDVEAGYRKGEILNPVDRGLADQLMPGGSIAALINLVDEVHTITSLAGFEALLRGRKVATDGQPFYAGWGLTTDNVPLNRRQRRLQIEELVAGTLILYPNYIDPVSRLLCGPEMLIARLAQPELWRPTMLMRLRHLEGWLRKSLARRPQFWAQSDA